MNIYATGVKQIHQLAATIIIFKSSLSVCGATTLVEMRVHREKSV